MSAAASIRRFVNTGRGCRISGNLAPVKTTLQLPDDLYREVKSTAALSGRSVTSIIEESLRDFLARATTAEPLPPLPVSHSSGGFTKEFLATGIEFNNTGEVLAWLDELEGPVP